MSNKIKYDLYVDLDGSLINTDILYESVLLLLKKNLLYFFILPIWLLKGKSQLKHRVSVIVDINPKTLPYNELFLSYLKEQSQQGRKLILATASAEKYAQAIADHLGIFNQVIASNREQNISGKNKLAKIKNISNNFAYAGNAKIDMIIFSESKESIIVSPTNSLKRRMAGLNNISHVFDKKQEV